MKTGAIINIDQLKTANENLQSAEGDNLKKEQGIKLFARTLYTFLESWKNNHFFNKELTASLLEKARSIISKHIAEDNLLEEMSETKNRLFESVTQTMIDDWSNSNLKTELETWLSQEMTEQLVAFHKR